MNAIWSDVFNLLLAYGLAIPIGWNRERESHRAGIRTLPIVAVASCGLALLAVRLPGSNQDGYSRVIQGLVTGIGFVGGGAILKDKGRVSGTATAASVLCVGIMGMAVGFGMYGIAIPLSVITFLTLKLIQPPRLQDRSDLPGKSEML